MQARLIFRGVYANYVYLAVAFVQLVTLTPIILHAVGPDAYGLWAVFNSLSGYFTLFDIGLNTAVAKYTAEFRVTRDREEVSRLVSTIFVVTTLIGTSVAVIIAALAPRVGTLFHVEPGLVASARVACTVMGLNVALVLVAGVLGNVIYGFQRVDLWRLCGALQIGCSTVLSVLFLRLHFGLVGLAFAALLATALAIGLYTALLKRDEYRISIRLGLFDMRLLREVLPFSWRTFMLGVTSRVLYYSDYVVIALFLGAAAVAPYEVAYKVCFLSTYLFSVITTTMFPSFAELVARGEQDRLRVVYLRIVRLSLVIFVPSAIVLLVFGRPLVRMWVGAATVAPLSLFAVLIAMNVFHAIGTPGAMLLQSAGRNRELMYAEIVNAVLNLAMSIVLIKWIGVLGVAVATLLAHVVTSFSVVLWMVCRTAGLSPFRYCIRVLLPPLLLGVPVLVAAMLWAWPFSADVGFGRLLAGSALSAAAYLLLYGLVGASGDERELARRYVSQLLAGGRRTREAVVRAR